MQKKKRKDDTGAYIKQWNKELKAELKQCVKAYEMKVKECRELRSLCNSYEKEHSTTFKKWQKDMEIIDRAIEYIETYTIDDKELLKILRGEIE